MRYVNSAWSRSLLSLLYNTPASGWTQTWLRNSQSFQEASDTSNYEFKMAETLEEFKRAFHLVYESYVENDFIQKRPHRVWLHPQQALPTTAVLIALHEGEVIATLSLIRDNTLGFPIEKHFPIEFLRQGPGQWTEMSAFAIDRSHRRPLNKNLFWRMIRYAFQFLSTQMESQGLLVEVPLSEVLLYQGVFGFQKVKHLQPRKIHGEKRVMMTLDLGQAREIHKDLYHEAPPEENLAWFLDGKDPHNHFPSKLPGLIAFQQFSRDHVEKFLIETDFLGTLSVKDLQKLVRSLVDGEDIEKRIFGLMNLRDRRVQFSSRALFLTGQSHFHQVHLRDFSSSGVRFFSEQSLDSDSGRVLFQVGSQRFDLPAKMVWRGDKTYGFQFAEKSVALETLIRETISRRVSPLKKVA